MTRYLYGWVEDLWQGKRTLDYCRHEMRAQIAGTRRQSDRSVVQRITVIPHIRPLVYPGQTLTTLSFLLVSILAPPLHLAHGCSRYPKKGPCL